MSCRQPIRWHSENHVPTSNQGRQGVPREGVRSVRTSEGLRPSENTQTMLVQLFSNAEDVRVRGRWDRSPRGCCILFRAASMVMNDTVPDNRTEAMFIKRGSVWSRCIKRISACAQPFPDQTRPEHTRTTERTLVRAHNARRQPYTITLATNRTNTDPHLSSRTHAHTTRAPPSRAPTPAPIRAHEKAGHKARLW